VKPRLGTSGRGRFDARDGRFDETRLRAATAALRDRGGALLEPWLERVDDLSVQLRIEPAGAVTVLGTLRLEASATGGYLGHRGEVDARGRIFSGHPRDEDLRAAAAGLASAAAGAGFHGVAGVDALTFRIGRDRDPASGGSRDLLRPVVELNARFTMGTVVAGLVRRSLPAVRAALGLAPGERRAFRFRLDAPPGGWERAAHDAGPGSLLVPLAPDAAAPRPGLLFIPHPDRLDRPGPPGAG
jgi:hypothetical protein